MISEPGSNIKVASITNLWLQQQIKTANTDKVEFFVGKISCPAIGDKAGYFKYFSRVDYSPKE